MPSSERIDVFIGVHKGLRQALLDLGLELGKLDWEDGAETASAGEKVKKLIHFLREHAANEDDFTFPLLESRSPGAAQAEKEEHHRLEKEIDGLESDFNRLAGQKAPERWRSGYEFYRAYNRFLSGYLAHMEREEGFITEALHRHFTDEEIDRDIQKIIQRTSPQDMGMMLSHMIPGMNPIERFRFLSKLRGSAPPPVFEKVRGLAQSVLAEKDWNKLSAKLGSV